MSKVILTYGTFDLFHIGHLRLLQRARALGDALLVGISTDEFNAIKGKRTVIDFSHRAEIVGSLRCVDGVFPETCWEQKPADVAKYQVSALVMGNDWNGKFDFLKSQCEVIYLPRTQGISTTELKTGIAAQGRSNVQDVRNALEILAAELDLSLSADGISSNAQLTQNCHECRWHGLHLFRLAAGRAR